MRKKSQKPGLKAKWLMSHPIEKWSRGDWGNPEERDAYYTIFDVQLVRLARLPRKRKKIVVKVFLDGVEIEGKWRKVWQHLHNNAMDMPVQKPAKDKGGQQ